ncbi:predicted protein [Postia placenta Mad-698-R]|nr:predicted protein [Postia placenta Mad-698-R]
MSALIDDLRGFGSLRSLLRSNSVWSVWWPTMKGGNTRKTQPESGSDRNVQDPRHSSLAAAYVERAEGSPEGWRKFGLHVRSMWSTSRSSRNIAHSADAVRPDARWPCAMIGCGETPRCTHLDARSSLEADARRSIQEVEKTAAEHSMSSAANHVDAWYGTAIDVISQLTVQFRVITAIIGFTVGRQRRVGHNQRSVALVAWEGSVQQQGLLWKACAVAQGTNKSPRRTATGPALGSGHMPQGMILHITSEEPAALNGNLGQGWQRPFFTAMRGPRISLNGSEVLSCLAEGQG